VRGNPSTRKHDFPSPPPSPRPITLIQLNLIGGARELFGAGWNVRAKSYLTRRFADIACNLDWLDAVPELKLIPMRPQWGRCTPAGAIHLNPALIRAPRVCIDYVILHELCHLREHNHSKQFYALLSQLKPNCQETKRELDKRPNYCS
jgi:predicted metal-dependent hydrolase